jgi:hypothetical protein
MPRGRTRKQFRKPNLARLASTMKRVQSKHDQIVHCVSQLRRFAHCLLERDVSRILQFGYNLGRLQELCGETLHPEIWWKPIETLVKKEQWGKLFKMIDSIASALDVEYDESVLAKGC